MQQQIFVGKHFLLGFILICAIIVADQYTKWLVMETMLRPEGPQQLEFMEWFLTSKKIEFFVHEREVFKTVVLAPFLNFVMVWNQGISFGMFNTNAPEMPLVFVAVSLLISILMIIWLAVSTRKTVAISLALIVGGALANVIDRTRFGAVMDFIDVHLNGHHWPAFNVADSCIVLGACVLMLDALLSKEGKKR